ncbi:3-hydroxyacyl-CoA dehydrogenase NAD-binding domain-containing protein [Candidatus Spongiihabitans sp.]|uniref:3-hydroxyacyl-CoA dehydrogenase NAD-binding domain-containing protein n=1 Tax=Candidatus Spongiihabitans sp. TaxID=3101308 RepID=UPI003C7C97A4
MLTANPQAVKNITCIGAGPIGGGWSAHYLARGYNVTTYLHDTAEIDGLHRLLETAWLSLTEMGLAPGASLDNLEWTTSLEDAVADAEFIQESIPEALELKQNLYQKLGDIVDPNVVIASSTSGLSMTDIQSHCRTPQRTLVAHPFNPPYLLPLVEMVGGEKTSRETVAWTERFYKAAGKAPLVMNKEVPGFIATRLQEAIWREALHMVANGEATVEQIDHAVVNGPGPRWALMGPCEIFHVGGGEGGMAYCLNQFGAALKLPWSRLVAPELTPELRDAMVDGCAEMCAGADFSSLSRKLNRGLVEIAQIKSRLANAQRSGADKSL